MLTNKIKKKKNAYEKNIAAKGVRIQANCVAIQSPTTDIYFDPILV
jgi:hypothetical protein